MDEATSNTATGGTNSSISLAYRFSIGATLGILMWLLLAMASGEERIVSLFPWYWPLLLGSGALALSDYGLLFVSGAVTGGMAWALLASLWSTLALLTGAARAPLPLAWYWPSIPCGGVLALAFYGLTTWRET